RMPTGSNVFEEAIAGMLAAGDPLNNVRTVLKTRLRAEAHEEAGIPEELVDQSTYAVTLSGLYPSTHSTDQILLGVLTGPALPEALRARLLATTSGLAYEHEAVQLVLTQDVNHILATTRDLKTRVLALMLRHHLQQRASTV